MDRKKLLEYLPVVMQNFFEMQEIMNTEDWELDQVELSIEKCLANGFLEDCDQDGIKKYEAILNVLPGKGETLKERKERVLLRWNYYVPYTMKNLTAKLAAYCGKDFIAECLWYDLYVKLGLTNKQRYEDVAAMLLDIVPCNIVIHLSIIYNQHRTLGKFTYMQLHGWTHQYIRNEVLEVERNINGKGDM